MISRYTTTSVGEQSVDQVPQVLADCARESVIITFDKICGQPTLCLDEIDCFDLDEIIGIISFAGDLTWSMHLGLPRDSAVTIARKFAGFEIPFESEDMGDAMGELANVLAGVVNGQLEAANVKAFMSLPTVARGSEVKLTLPGNLLSQVQYFSTMNVNFWLKLIVAKRVDKL